MTLASYTDLTAFVARTLRRTDLTDDIPMWIALAEAQINRRLRVRRMTARAQAQIAGEYAALPASFAGVQTFDMETGDTLSGLDPEVLADLALRRTTAGTPRHYAVVGQSFRFWPVPDDTYTAELTYYLRIPPLTAANPTNWLITDHPDVYLYGVLTQSAPFLKADERLPVWSGLFLTALEDVKSNDSDDLHSGRQAPLRIDMPFRRYYGPFVSAPPPPAIQPPLTSEGDEVFVIPGNYTPGQVVPWTGDDAVSFNPSACTCFALKGGSAPRVFTRTVNGAPFLQATIPAANPAFPSARVNGTITFVSTTVQPANAAVSWVSPPDFDPTFDTFSATLGTQ